MAKAELKIIGSSPARMGGVERVVGKGVYGIDLMLKDQLHGAILRSQYAHVMCPFCAKIVSLFPWYRNPVKKIRPASREIWRALMSM